MKMKFQDVKPILTIEDSELKLSERSDEIDLKVQNNLMREIISALKHTIEANNIISLSAPAIGYQRRIFCIKFDTEIKTFINPVIINQKGIELSKEICTSIPGRTFIRPRNNDITVMYQKPTGAIETRQLVGLTAIVFQHELDHLEGLLLSDIGLEIDSDFDSATEEEQNEIIDFYLESLDLKRKELDDEIKNNEELSKLKSGIDFITSVYKGETTIEKYNNKGDE